MKNAHKKRAIKHPPVYTTGTHVVRLLGKTEYQFHEENKKYKHWFKYKGVSMPLMTEEELVDVIADEIISNVKVVEE